MNKMKYVTILTICSILLITLPTMVKGIEINEEDSNIENSDPPIPTTDFIDYGNGTTQMIIDYNNGTKDIITETLLITMQEYSLVSDTQTEPFSTDTPTSTEECTDWIETTYDAIFEQEIKLGISWTLAQEHWKFIDIDWGLTGHMKSGIYIDIGFGIRLPIRVKLEYPEQMTVGKDYECYATLIPLDLPNYKEFYCSFASYIYLDIAVLIFSGYWTYGPSYDFSRDLKTPIGPSLEFPVGPFTIDLLNLIDIFKLQVVIDPDIGSDKITAKASATGDAKVIGENDEKLITWTDQNQKIPFTVHPDDYSSTTDLATIMLSDFRYYFDHCILDFDLKVNLHQAINDFFGIGDPSVDLFTIDLKDLIQVLYLGVLAGEDPIIDPVPVFVQRFGINIIITPSTREIVPGEIGVYNIHIINLGNVVDTFMLSKASLPITWDWFFSTDTVTLDPGASTNVQLTIKPYRHYTTSPGDYSFTITGTSQGADLEDLTVTDSENAIVKVLEFYELAILLTPLSDSTEPGGTRTYTVDVKNLGNVLDSFDFDFEFIDFNGLFRVYPTAIQGDWVIVDPSIISNINPGTIGTALLAITAPFDWSGMENAIYEFITIANSLGDSSVSDYVTASITIESTLESRVYYIDHELEILRDIVASLSFVNGFMKSFQSQLDSALNKKAEVHQNIIDGRIDLVDNRLKTVKNILEAFIHHVEAQYNKKIQLVIADILIEMANEIIYDIDATLSYLIYGSSLGMSVGLSNNFGPSNFNNLAQTPIRILLICNLLGTAIIFSKKLKYF